MLRMHQMATDFIIAGIVLFSRGFIPTIIIEMFFPLLSSPLLFLTMRFNSAVIGAAVPRDRGRTLRARTSGTLTGRPATYLNG